MHAHVYATHQNLTALIAMLSGHIERRRADEYILDLKTDTDEKSLSCSSERACTDNRA